MELDVAKKDGCSFLYIDIKKTISKGTKLVEARGVRATKLFLPCPAICPCSGPKSPAKVREFCHFVEVNASTPNFGHNVTV